jgi:hypothetical protein
MKKSMVFFKNIIRMTKSRSTRWMRTVANMRNMRNAYRVLFRKPDGKGSFGRPIQRWKDNIKTNINQLSVYILCS